MNTILVGPINVRKHHYTALKCISALCQRFSADNSEMISIMASDTERMKRNQWDKLGMSTPAVTISVDSGGISRLPSIFSSAPVIYL